MIKNFESIYSINETIALIKINFFKKQKLITPKINSHKFNSELVESIYYHTKQYKNITLFMRCKFLCDLIDNKQLECPFCYKEVVMVNRNLGKTCGAPYCKHRLLSEIAKERGTWMLQTNQAREHKRISLTGRKLSEINKQRIGESNAKKWTEEYKKLDRERRILNGSYKKISYTLKKKILCGELTPKSENRKRAKRIKSHITNIQYRSNWELIFHEENPNLKYEFTRIEYTENGNERIYITDFTDLENKIIYEIKPSSELNSLNFVAKKHAAEKWCSINNFTYKVVTELNYKFYGR
jgi:hypothetical protein